jgi:precorrin-6A synthase
MAHVARSVTLIGIGPGDPRYVTAEAAETLASTDVFVMLDKGDETSELVQVRRAILDRYAPQPHRVVDVPDAERSRAGDYRAGVSDWHTQRAVRVERVLLDDVADGERVGVLVWGDPSLYDSTIRLLDEVASRGQIDVDVDVVPGVSSVQLLAARHRLVLNRIGGSVLVTTGRRLTASGLPPDVDDVVVMLDGEMAFTRLTGQGLQIYWGAYLGLRGELLAAGPLDDVAGEIVEMRRRAREERGWIFDIYLLRRLAS